jgi:acetyltransferase-like isoleucine patch superfamily enzyme
MIAIFIDRIDQTKEGISEAIHIGDHVWVATRAIIMKGVTIGDMQQ